MGIAASRQSDGWGVFLWEGILKFVYANQGIGRFTKLGMPLPHFTAEYAQLLTAVFLMINGPGRMVVGYSPQQTTKEPRSGRSGIAAKGIRKRVCNGVADHVLVLRAQEPAQAVGIHDVLPGHVGDRLGRNCGNLMLP